MPSRRHVLTSAALFASVGCLGTRPATTPTSGSDPTPTSSASPEPESTTDSTETDASTGTDDCQSGVTVSLSPFDPVERIARPVDDPARPLVERAVGDGTERGATELSTYGRPPIREGSFLRYDGAFYRVGLSQGARESVPARELAVEWNAGQEAPTDATPVSYASLPEDDRFVLRLAIFGPRYERGTDRHPKQGLSVRAFPAPYPDGTEDSELVAAGRSWVEWQGRVYRVEIDGETETERRTYRYEFDRVSSSPEAFREFVADEYLVALNDLPPEQQRIVERALDGGYEECEPVSSAFEGFRERMHAASDLPQPYDGAWYVRYDGERYRLELLNWEV